jgi:hypothetical protein
MEIDDRYSSVGLPRGYRVTRDGTIQSAHQRGTRTLGMWRALRPSLDAKGYAGLTICDTETGKRMKLRVHRIVARAFVPNPDGLPCVRHLDGDKANNSAANIAWGTYRDNEEDKRRHGTYDLRRSGGKLNPDKAAVIRWHVSNGERRAALAVEYGVSVPTIGRIVNWRIWL